tara:strand:+ start:38 stop:844 length:807 start_codon:yes stop_codon:yes gene_type:complete
MKDKLRVLSLGAGVQSTTLALMIEKGEVPMVDCAIFADTMAEPKKVYDHLNWLQKQLSYPLYKISYRNLKQDIIDAVDGKYKFMSIPLFTRNAETGKKGLLRRQCTADYKITPINRKVRELLGYQKGQRVKKGTKVEMLMGISMDEIVRTRINRLKYIENVYPLIEFQMRRHHCLQWMEKNNYPRPPRSACTFCPYHSNEEWKDIKKNKEEWDEVVALDKKIRKGTKKNTDLVYLHKSAVPLDEADLEPNKNQQDLFDDICDEGMCGV